jgi:hypothetical protein
VLEIDLSSAATLAAEAAEAAPRDLYVGSPYIKCQTDELQSCSRLQDKAERLVDSNPQYLTSIITVTQTKLQSGETQIVSAHSEFLQADH